MKIAIIGSGISGATLAHYLHPLHDITVFEANDYIGGHTHTHKIDYLGKSCHVDTGFIVFNDKTYPNFIQLLNQLGVSSQKSNMSFSVKSDITGLEYNGTTLNSLFAQRRNLLRPSFYRMIRDILRFNHEAPKLLTNAEEIELGQYLALGKYSHEFVNQYIIPMGAAIWSTNAKQMLDFPAKFFIRFFHNHGMLSINERPQWYTIIDGSHRYMQALTSPFIDKIRLSAAVIKVKRLRQKVHVYTEGGGKEIFDWVFFACHSDQALSMLEGSTPLEQKILSSFPYQENEAVLHTDSRILPRRKLAWAAWNYHIPDREKNQVALTYHMNILQNIAYRPKQDAPLLVSLNDSEHIASDKIIKKMSYHHPLYTKQSTEAQHMHHMISGVNRTGYAGAYWGNGFHEDGVVSAMAAIAHFEKATHAS